MKPDSLERCYAILPAGGSGSRFGGEIPKQFLAVEGRPLIAWAIETFVTAGVGRVIIAVASGHENRMRDIVRAGSWSAPVDLVPGGATRQDSVRNALANAGSSEMVAVHDAVRPAFTEGLLRALIAAAAAGDGAIPGSPLTDTIHRVRGGVVDESPRREEWVAAQTPQVFRTAVLAEALERARTDGFVGTDDASVVTRYDRAVRVIPGEAGNLKVTHPGDLERVAAILRERRRS